MAGRVMLPQLVQGQGLLLSTSWLDPLLKGLVQNDATVLGGDIFIFFKHHFSSFQKHIMTGYKIKVNTFLRTF
jgi:hypothetical protein